MNAKIIPVQSSYRFPKADTLQIHLVFDDLETRCIFAALLGMANKDGSFSGDLSSSSSIVLDGDLYAKWSGSNVDVPAIVAAQMGVTIAAVVKPAPAQPDSPEPATLPVLPPLTPATAVTKPI